PASSSLQPSPYRRDCPPLPEFSTAGRGAERAQSAEQEVPRRVHRRVDNRGGKDGARSAPRPAVENSGNGGQRDVAPVGKSQIGDVGKPEENRSRPPADNFAFGRPR